MLWWSEMTPFTCEGPEKTLVGLMGLMSACGPTVDMKLFPVWEGSLIGFRDLCGKRRPTVNMKDSLSALEDPVPVWKGSMLARKGPISTWEGSMLILGVFLLWRPNCRPEQIIYRPEKAYVGSSVVWQDPCRPERTVFFIYRTIHSTLTTEVSCRSRKCHTNHGVTWKAYKTIIFCKKISWSGHAFVIK